MPRFRWLLIFSAVLSVSLGAVAQNTRNPTTPTVDSARVKQREQEPVQSGADNKEFANPSVLGMGPSKGITLRYERAPRVGVTSISDATIAGNGSGQVSKLNVLEGKLYAPLWRRPHLKAVLGFNFSRQQFNFADRAHLAYPLYRTLDDRNLRTVGSQLLLLRPIDGRRYYLFRVKGELNGDYKQDAEDGQYRRLPLRKYLRTSAEFFYGWKRSPRQSVGVGMQFGYTFGRRSLFPAVLYNRTFNDHWGVEALLPAKVRVRYNINDKTLIYCGYEVQGDSYTINIDSPPLADNRTVELRVTSLTGRFRLERELLPVLWFGLEAGYRYYASFDIFDSSTARNKLIDSSLRAAPAISAELFLTPPRRFLKQ